MIARVIENCADGAWDFAADDVFRSNAVEIGYDKGVPMGGDLTARPSGAEGPVFMVGAMKMVYSLVPSACGVLPVRNTVERLNLHAWGRLSGSVHRERLGDNDRIIDGY